MYRILQTTRPTDPARVAGFALAAAALVALSACSFRKDDTGGRPPEETPPAPVVATVDTSGGSVTPDAGQLTPVSYDDAESAYRERRYGEAENLFASYVERRPDNPWGHYMLGLSAWKHGELQRAESAFVRSLELDPRNVKGLLNLSRVLLDDGRPKEARTSVRRALEIDSTSGEGYRLLGRVHASLNQPDEAMTAYRLALSLDPTDAWSMNNLGLLLIQQERDEEALGPLARAVQLDSTVAVFQNNLGIALERTGHFALATLAYQAALSADSGYTRATLSLARVQGRTEDPSLPPVELGTLAEGFDREVRSVQLSAGTRKPPEPQR